MQAMFISQRRAHVVDPLSSKDLIVAVDFHRFTDGLGPIRYMSISGHRWYTFGTCRFWYDGGRFRYINVLR